jgi:POT family proton-dependent oligopeptide transporter
MILAAAAYSILIIASLNLPSPRFLNGLVAPAGSQVSVYWLISTYFLVTIAELFLSPIGISFVSRVAPPKYKGLMQGGWFAATAVGNSLVGVTAFFWERLPLWTVWAILAGACVLSAAFIFSIMKRLERVARA